MVTAILVALVLVRGNRNSNSNSNGNGSCNGSGNGTGNGIGSRIVIFVSRIRVIGIVLEAMNELQTPG